MTWQKYTQEFYDEAVIIMRLDDEFYFHKQRILLDLLGNVLAIVTWRKYTGEFYDVAAKLLDF